jgi:predicted small secreted protein
MKKIFYSFAILAMVFASCNPMEDIYDDIDAQTNADAVVGDVVLTLSDDDYADLDLSFGNFSSEEDAKAMLPAFLSEKYPTFGVIYNADGSIKEASSAAITYKLYSPISLTDYTVTDEDYADFGSDNLTTDAQFDAFLSSKFTSPNGSIVNLTYNTLVPQIEYTLTDDDYDSVGNGNFNNFDIRPGRDEETEESRRVKIETILLANFPDSAVGQQYLVTYAIYDGSSGTRQMLVQLSGNNTYDLINGYTLTNADYDLVGNGRFNNFDIRPGRDEETEESRRVKIETILLTNFPATAVGDQYFVTYAIYDGSAGTRNMLLEFNGTGYDLIGATLVSMTSKFVYTGEWAKPLTFTPEEYTLMGQRFSNFSDEDEAEYKIGIYLRTLYPFAAPDDFVAVEYDFYDGSNTSQRNVNFVFDGAVWNAIPTVIDSVLQFAHDGSTWVPDNTIKYTLTNADYALVGNGNFNNFDVRAGRDEETVEARLVKINTILLNNFPQYGEGQKFSVSYNVWKPGDDVFVMNVINNGTEYVLQ